MPGLSCSGTNWAGFLRAGSCRSDTVAGWKSVDEIVAYQLSVRLRREVLKLTREGPASRDFTFRNQIRDSARSAPRNLSEGFSRYHHGEFAQFASIAKASLTETRNHLVDAREEQYLTLEDYLRMDKLAEEAERTTSGLIRHLRTSDAPRPYWDVSTRDRVPHRPARRTVEGPIRRRKLTEDVDVEY